MALVVVDWWAGVGYCIPFFPTIFVELGLKCYFMDDDVKICSITSFKVLFRLLFFSFLVCHTFDVLSIYREIEKEEFKKVMALMRAQNRQGAQHRDGLRTGLKFSGSVENGGLVEYFFGKDGKDPLQVDKFLQFMRDLHEEVSPLLLLHQL